MTKPMKLLMLEDDEYECNRFKNIAENRSDVILNAVTNSCNEAINYIKTNSIDGIILDVELHNGYGGSGLKFLEDLKTLDIDTRPIIIVTTNIVSTRTHNILHKFGVEVVYCKNQPDYCPELVLDTFLVFRDSLGLNIPNNVINDEKLKTIENRNKWITKMITSELEAVGLINRLLGSKFIIEAIEYILKNEDDDTYYLPYLMKKYKTGHTNIGNAMQTAINSAWNNVAPDDLSKNYTAKISYKRGTPTPIELVHYYVDKIRKKIS